MTALLNPVPAIKSFFSRSEENGSSSTNAQSDREFFEICTLAPEAALAKLGVTDKGIEPAEADARRLTYGLNEIAKRKRLGFVGEILQRFKNPLVIQLLIIAGVSYA